MGKNCSGGDAGGPYFGLYTDDVSGGGTPYSGRYVVSTVGIRSCPGTKGHPECDCTLSSSQPRP